MEMREEQVVVFIQDMEHLGFLDAMIGDPKQHLPRVGWESTGSVQSAPNHAPSVVSSTSASTAGQYPAVMPELTRSCGSQPSMLGAPNPYEQRPSTDSCNG